MATPEPFEDLTAGQVEMAVVKDDFSYELGRKHGLLANPVKKHEMTIPSLNKAEHYRGLMEELNKLIRDGKIPRSRAVDVIRSCGHLFDDHDLAYPEPAVRAKDVTEENVRAVQSSRMGNQHGLLGADPMPALSDDIESYKSGYYDGVVQALTEGRCTVNTARALLAKIGDDLSEHQKRIFAEVVPEGIQYDPVKVPQHYNTGKIEVANFIADQELAYPADNIIKYVARAGKKDPAKKLEDIEKAAAYLQMMHNIANGLPAVVRDPETHEVVWTLFRN